MPMASARFSGMSPTTAPVAAPAPAPTFVRVFSPELAQATSASSAR